MKKMQIKNSIYVLSMLAVAATGCKKDFDNPNETPQEVVYKNPITAAGAAVGLQRLYTSGQASSLYAIVDANSLLTKETFLLNQGNIGEYQLSLGKNNVDGTNNVLNNIWYNSNKIIFDANNVINYGNTTTDKAYGSGLVAFASIYKALALGNMANFWDHVPDTITAIDGHAGFITNVDGWKKAVNVLNSAIAAVTANAPSTQVLARLPADISLTNTLYALKARYSLFAGDYDAALEAANKVDLGAKSVMNFVSPAINPVFESATGPNNMFQPVDSTLGLLPQAIEPDKTDKRILFHIRIKTETEKAPRFRINGFYLTSSTAVPYYLPGEIMLIKAEAMIRKSTPDIAGAITELNKVLTKKAAGDVYGIGADLPPYAGSVTEAALLKEIYRNRCIELYMTGMKLNDMRRFGMIDDGQAGRMYVPYPFRERDNNPNTPKDPVK
ncbi:RagB/SusD family nutrient uptake outer membrane protein [Pseudoflavitalea sp. G-6-1-2]|uniref:RagB/SusD family nutrient uptake outer membrane protein n=1 Tax=Pseudoflavitalea sp. G-6-1-2 TaxID=2728841 RepID=UPI00146BF892|nr:RagB/SusD family nutrient uptake outer membrane protein [Pseudoflavitalea sp. G-6-1-2]NML20925.1 RagB/SusD family nutrient uptake outer membrane protein [Pseudoflavitalea sp. G-6-1-2]